MVTGLELLLNGIGTNVFSFILKQILKKQTSYFESKESVNTMLKEMKRFIEDGKTPDCSSSTRPGSGVPEYLKKLIQKLDEGNKIVQKGENKEELDQWIELLGHLLPRAMLESFTVVAGKEKDITPLIDSNQGNPLISLPLHFNEDKDKKSFRKFIDCANTGSESLLQVDSVSTDKTKDAEQMKQSVPQASKVVAESGQFPESVDNPSEEKLVLKKVVFGVLACDGYAKRKVEQAYRKCKVKGILYAELKQQDNERQDIVKVIGTEIFDDDHKCQELLRNLKC